MQKFILRRKITRTERAEIEAENWEAAKLALHDDSTEFEVIVDNETRQTIEYIGDV